MYLTQVGALPAKSASVSQKQERKGYANKETPCPVCVNEGRGLGPKTICLGPKAITLTKINLIKVVSSLLLCRFTVMNFILEEFSVTHHPSRAYAAAATHPFPESAPSLLSSLLKGLKIGSTASQVVRLIGLLLVFASQK